MSRVESRINSRSEEFLANTAHMQGLVDDLRAQIARIRLGGGEANQQRHQSRGKLLVRDRIDALLVGPGLGRSENARERLETALSTGKRLVIDADTLHLLDQSMLDGRTGSTIAVTPHEGELAALCNAFEVKGDDKIARAEGLQAATGMTVLAKGPDSVLVGPDGVRFFDQGSSWLSAAGTGDVLAGIAASRLAVHGEPQRALEEAVWLHHEAARLAGPAFTAGQLAQAVKPAMETLL